MCTNIRSWNVTEIQLAHQLLAKCYYLNSGRKGARSPKAAAFIFILSKCDCEVTPNSIGYFLPFLSLHIMKSNTLPSFVQVAHIFIHSPFFQQNGYENKKYHNTFQKFYSRNKETTQVKCTGLL